MKDNPYPGTREFGADEKENFFGRREEIDILAALVLARRTSLLFAQSGAGKSSLINAGLVPELTRQEEIGRGRRRRTVQKMHVLPVAGVGGGIPSRLGRPLENVFVFSALHSLFPEAEPDELAGRRLAGGVAPLVEEAGGQDEAPVLLVFDQFEELFTQHVERWRERLPFFEQIAEALKEHPGLHVLLSIREDFIAELTPFADLLPGGLRDRFRLERLRPELALEAVRGPAERAGSPFAKGVAEELVDNLRRGQAGRRRDLRVPEAESSHEPALGEYVEPVHLQTVCRRLWENLDDDRTSIEQRDLQQFGDVDQALTGFYREGLRRVLERTAAPEHRLRGWFEETNLITPARTRGLVYRDREETEGLPNTAVDQLVEAYLIRSTRRGSDTWYELAHDRLVEPILAANREWRVEHLKPLTVAAEAWEAAEKDPRKLYSGVLLAEARAAARTKPKDHSEVELAFVAASLGAEQALVRRQRRQLGIVIGVAAVLVTAGFLYFRSASERRLRVSGQLAAYSAGQLEEDPELSLLLALAAVKLSPTAEAEYALRWALLKPQVLSEADNRDPIENRSAEQVSPDGCSVKKVQESWPFRKAALSPDNQSIAAGDVYGVVRIATAGPKCVEEILKGPGNEINAHREQVNSVVFSDDGELLLTASDDGTAAVWTVASGRLLARLRGHRERVLTAAFGPEDSSLILTSGPETTRRWRIALPRPLRRKGITAEELRFSRDGRRLVAVFIREARVWDTETGREIARLEAPPGSILNRAAFSPRGEWLATAGGDGIVRVENLEDRTALSLAGHEAEVLEIAFSPDGERLLSRGDDGTARLWDWRTKRELNQLSHEGEVTGAAFSRRGDRVVTTGRDGTAKVWSLADGELLAALSHPDAVFGASFDQAGRRIVTACKDGTVRLWETNGELSTALALGEVGPESALYDASFSPDGHSVLVWGRAKVAYLWRPEDENTALVLPDLNGDLGSPSFSTDGRFVLTFDETRARAWDTVSPTGRMIVELPIDSGGASSRPAVRALSWSADGRQLAVAWERGRIELQACEVCRPLDDPIELDLIKLARERMDQRQPKRQLTEEEKKKRYLP